MGKEIRTEMIAAYMRALLASFGKICLPIDQHELRKLHQEKDFAGMVRFVRASLNLDLRIQIAIVKNRCQPNVPARIIGSIASIPPYGTDALRITNVTIYFQKMFLEKRPFEMIVAAIAHELSHVVLYAIRHPLRNQKEAVDLTAMMLGYRDFFRDGCQHADPELERSSFENRLRALFGQKQAYTIGYLTPPEIQSVAIAMNKLSKTQR